MQLKWHGGRLKVEADKKKYRRWTLLGFIIGTSLIFWVFVFIFLFQNSKSRTPLPEDIIIANLEQYKIANGYYPDVLDKINIKKEDYIYYQYIGPDRYALVVITGFLDNRYHSASKHWSEVGSPKDEIDSADDLEYERGLVKNKTF